MNYTPLVLLSGFLAASASAQDATDVRSAGSRGVESAIDSILSGLTLEEKVGQLIAYSGNSSANPEATIARTGEEDLIRSGKIGAVFNVVGSSQTHELQRIAVRESRARIPLLFGLDVIHGFRTTFPVPLAEASSWDVQAVQNAARIAALEASSAGIDWTFAPMVDIARDPRWGRIVEGAGEDPFLGSLMAEAYVRGYQGSSLDDASSIVACAKHFAAYGGAEGGRDYNTVDISERTLRDVYLPPFKAARDAGAGTFMASFNEIGGVPSSCNSHLLTDILRREWKFDGFVVSDWGSIGELRAHGVASTSGEAARLALNAGLDMDMMSECYSDSLAALVRQGTLSEGALNEAVRRVLRIKFRLGLFRDPYRAVSPQRERATILAPAHLEAAREMARKSIVLLKNDHALLPLSKDLASIAVIGPLADSRLDPLGPWSAEGRPEDVVSVLDGIRKALPKAQIHYAAGCTVSGTDTAGFAEALAEARKAQAVLLVLGESSAMSGEAASRSSLDLPGRQEDLIREVVGTGRPVVLILMNGRPLTLRWEAEHVGAILETWFLGIQSGLAVADVVFGEYNPSGRLPVTFPRALGQIPCYYNHKSTGRPSDDTLQYTSHYLDLPSSPLYPFGYGLSFTTFAYRGLSLERGVISEFDTLKASVLVSNTGTRAGEETVQLYVRQDVGSVTRPVEELKAFRKVRLAPNESATVRFALPLANLAFTGLDMRARVEAGAFHLKVGPNSAEGLETQFRVVEGGRR